MNADQPVYDLAEVARMLNGMVLTGTITEIHEKEVKAQAEVKSNAGMFKTSWLPVYGRKLESLRIGEKVVMISPEGNPALGVLFCFLHDREQDIQNERLNALELCCEESGKQLIVMSQQIEKLQEKVSSNADA